MKPQAAEDREAVLDRLRITRDRNKGVLPDRLVKEASRLLDRSPRTVRRWMEDRPKNAGSQIGSRRQFVLNLDQHGALLECHGDCAAAVRLLKARELEAPSVRTMQRAKNRLPAYDREYLSGGPLGARQKRLSLIRERPGRFEVLEADQTLVDAMVIPPRGVRPVRPWITLFICTTTKVIAGICVSLNATQSDVLACMGAAFGRNPDLSPAYGIPTEIRIDRGLQFTAKSVAEAAALLDTVISPNWPHQPQHKATVERVFRTMKYEFFRNLPHATFGPKGLDKSMVLSRNMEPISYKLFVQLALHWVHTYNYERPHSTLGGKTPAEAWAEDTTIINEASETELRRFLRRDLGERTVEGRGVYAHKQWYTADFLAPLIESEVEVRDVPHDTRQVMIYQDGNYLGSAKPHEDQTEEERQQILRAKREAAQVSAVVSASLTKKSEARFAGMIAAGEPEEITDITPEDIEKYADVRSEEASDLALRLLAERKRRKPGKGVNVNENPFFKGRDDMGGLK